MTELPAYLTGLCAACLWMALVSHRIPSSRMQLMRIAGVLFANWVAVTAYVRVSGDYDPWVVNLAVDIPSAIVVMWRPASRGQAYIGVLYWLQIAGHLGYGARELLGMHSSAVFYYDAITWVAWAQLLTAGVWAGGIWIRNYRDNRRHRRNALDRWQGAFNTFRGKR